jgi:ABC-type nitrate/sulfonate/bicarbonate transport system permease component
VTVGARLRRALGNAASPLAVLAAWELLARSGLVSAYLLPPASTVALRVVEAVASGEVLREGGRTLVRMLVGYVLAAALGVALGVLMARVRPVRWFLDPMVSIGFPVPKISFLPIFVLWFGLFDLPKIVMTVFACVFPVITATWAGTQGVDKFLVWSAQNVGARDRALLWEVILPAALPQVFTGLQVALPIAFIVVIVTEMLTGGGGLGGAMMEGQRFADSPRVFANLVVIALLGLLAMKGLERLRRRCLVWHEEVQRGFLGT